MQTATQPSLFRSKLFLLGVFLLFLAAVMWLALSLTTAHEQALTPGEKNLGVAALAMLFGLPLLFFGASGVGVLLLSIVLFLYRKFSRRGQPQPMALIDTRGSANSQ
jgi:hypothetical protein